ncbi:MAG: sigma-54-dependent Fis family transcriptional regulator [Acidobacteria bacterium]|nr:sigma-54-dependent Fis family transcriptional regulator [Acidobacteriota bacterium]
MATTQSLHEPQAATAAEAGPLRLLVVDDDRALRSSLERVLVQNGYQVLAAENAQQARAQLETQSFAVVLLDLVLPDAEGLELLREVKATQPETEVLVVTAYGSIESAVEAMRWGAYDYLTKPFHPAELLTTLGKALEKIALQRENRSLRYQLSQQTINRILVGSSVAMQRVKKLIEQVAPSSAPVIIEGESGTGKELVAEALHQASGRAAKPLIKLSCAALPETLLEAELFGYERGAFTGAVSRKQGRFDLAHGGTLFLDEIVDIPQTTQVKLLRVLQDGKYERLGGRETLYSDVRLIAATNRNLEQAVREGKFREDLYYRLNVITLPLPPLRARKDEIPVLAHHFRHLYAARNHKTIPDISPAAMSCLFAYDWPGNVRELENVIERAVVLCEGEVIQPRLLPEALNPTAFRTTPADTAQPDKPSIITLSFPVGTSMRQIEDLSIQALLEHAQNDRAAAASLLDIHPRTIARHLHNRQPH